VSGRTDIELRLEASRWKSAPLAVSRVILVRFLIKNRGSTLVRHKRKADKRASTEGSEYLRIISRTLLGIFPSRKYINTISPRKRVSLAGRFSLVRSYTGQEMNLCVCYPIISFANPFRFLHP